MDTKSNTHTWPELAIGLYDALTDRNAEITYDFQNLELAVPSGTGSRGVDHANWKVNGVLKVRTRDLEGKDMEGSSAE